jgi:hypothetical protein
MSDHVVTHPKTRRRRERALQRRKDELARWKRGEYPDGYIVSPVPGGTKKDVKRRIEQAKADIRALEKKLDGR